MPQVQRLDRELTMIRAVKLRRQRLDAARDDEAARWNVARHHRTGRDKATFTDRDAGQDRAAAADHDVVLERGAARGRHLLQAPRTGVVEERDAWADEDVIAQPGPRGNIHM